MWQRTGITLRNKTDTIDLMKEVNSLEHLTCYEPKQVQGGLQPTPFWVKHKTAASICVCHCRAHQPLHPHLSSQLLLPRLKQRTRKKWNHKGTAITEFWTAVSHLIPMPSNLELSRFLLSSPSSSSELNPGILSLHLLFSFKAAAFHKKGNRMFT